MSASAVIVGTVAVVPDGIALAAGCAYVNGEPDPNPGTVAVTTVTTAA
jgi:hypothetical protein